MEITLTSLRKRLRLLVMAASIVQKGNNHTRYAER